MGLKINIAQLSGLSQTSKTSQVNQPISNLQQNNPAQNDETIQFLTNKVSTNPVSNSRFDEIEREKTLNDFLNQVLRQQPVAVNDENADKVRLTMKVGKSAPQTTREDYNLAFRRAVYNRAMDGLKLSDEEIKQADKALIEAGLYQSYYNLQGSLDGLKADQQRSGNELPIAVGKQNIEYARRAGQAVLQYQAYQTKKVDEAVEKGERYATDTLGGFVQPIVNAPINIINGVSEPFRAGERAIFGTSNIPEVPRMTVAERSEYWNKDGRLVINRGAEIGATIALGGAAGGKAIGTQAGRIFLGTESAYNIGAGIIGKDVTQTDAQGNARQMPMWERGLRVTGGIFGARQTINTEIATPNSAVNKLDDIFKNPPTFKPHGEFVTPEGFRIKTTVEQIPDNVLLSKAKAQETNTIGRRNLDSHEGVSGVQEGKQIGHTNLKHVGKSEKWLQERIRREGIREASSFYPGAVGNRTVGVFKKRFEAEINYWLKNGKDEKFIAEIDMKEGIGLVVKTNKKGTPLPAEEATKAKIVLVKDNSEYGWHLFTVMLQK